MKKEKEFEWDSFKKPSERIKKNSVKYKDVDIRDAFAEEYGLKLRKNKKSNSENLYHEVQPGEVIPLKINYIDKKTVEFCQSSFKETIVSAVNLYQYKRFKTNVPKETVMCKVVSKTQDKIVVDPLAPMFDSWIKGIMDNLKSQYNIKKDHSVKVQNLKVIRNTYNGAVSGGFTGDVRVDNVSKFCGQDIMVKAFIPGSQIVLNIENDFDKWNDKTVKAFVSNYIDGSGTNKPGKMSLICSAKEYLKFQGDKNKVDIFNEYCLDSEKWKKIQNTIWEGNVTGIINSSKKQGVFVEIPKLSMTGMIEMKSSLLNNYAPGMKVNVMLDRIDEPMYMNTDVGQMQHKTSVIMDGDILKKCNLRFVFKLAE